MHQPRILGRQGYTMIETVTTLVVAGILTAVGVVFLAPASEQAPLPPFVLGDAHIFLDGGSGGIPIDAFT